jgi:hypothetical protein
MKREVSRAIENERYQSHDNDGKCICVINSLLENEEATMIKWRETLDLQY